MFELVIKNGRVMDGTGNPWFYGDVAIKDGKIQKIGFIDSSSANSVIDAKGLVVAPGFVEIHSHADFILPLREHPRILEPLVRQGVTTIVVGNCGYSPAPINPQTIAVLKTYASFLQAEELQWEWSDMGNYLDFIQTRGVAYNVIPLVSHGAIRIALRGFESGPATDTEKEEMARLTQKAMEDGAFGLSCGLIYAPGMYSDTDELIAISRPLRDFGGIFTSHVRGSSETLLPATREIIKIGEENGIAVEHSHFEAFGKEHWPKIEEALRLHDEARARGIDIGFDVIPYIAANTTLLAIFPPWSIEGGVSKLVERLRKKEVRKRIAVDIEKTVSTWPPWVPGAWPHNLVRATGWENIFVISVNSPDNKRLEGKSLAEIGRDMNKTPFDVAVDLAIEEEGKVMALYVGVSGDLEDEKWLRRILSHPRAAICTDAIITGRGVPHLAAYGAFPKVLGYYSRDLKLFPMEEAIRKMTSASLQRFGIRDRGLIREGCFADITIFDEATVGEKGTYFDPAHFAEGIEYVIINGIPVLQNGRYNSKLCGQVLRKQGR
jgi:N-acyl-D-amino-acid deacylase